MKILQEPMKFGRKRWIAVSYGQQTQPADNKWYKNARAFSSLLSKLKDTVSYIRQHTEELPINEFDLSVDPELLNGLPIGRYASKICAVSLKDSDI